MELLIQNDKRWKGEKLGKSKWTIGNSGCVITSLCNCHNLAGNDYTPDELNRKLTEINGYTKDGDLYWESAAKILGCKINPFAWQRSNYPGKMNEVLSERINYHHHIICRYINSGYQHFTNVINTFLNYVVIFDVYDGKIKVMPKADINRLVSVDYKL